MPTKRLKLPTVLFFIPAWAFVYCANKETQTAQCFVLLHLCVPLFIMPTKRLKPPTVLFFISVCACVYCANKETQTAHCFVLHLSVCLYLLCQQRDSDCPVFCSSSSLCANSLSCQQWDSDCPIMCHEHDLVYLWNILQSNSHHSLTLIVHVS